MTDLRRILYGAVLASASCASGPAPTGGTTDLPIAQTAMDHKLAALHPTRLEHYDDIKALDTAIQSHFERNQTRRSYVMTDKPLYQPGETIWFRADLRATGTLLGQAQAGITMQLVSPRGAIVMQKRVNTRDGVAQNDFQLPAEALGGEYTIQLAADDGTTDFKKIVVNTYDAPRLMKTVEFVRKAYGEGDQVSAAVQIKRATGEPFANKALTGVVTVDDVEVTRVAMKSDGEGRTTAKFALPAHIARGDGLLTIGR